MYVIPHNHDHMRDLTPDQAFRTTRYYDSDRFHAPITETNGVVLIQRQHCYLLVWLPPMV